MPAKDAPVRKRMTPIQLVETIAHPSRWALLKALDKPKSAQTLAPEVDLSVANVIYHMRFLVAAGVVRIGKDPEYITRQVYHRKAFEAEIQGDREGKMEIRFSKFG